jgi:hypothetical protein
MRKSQQRSTTKQRATSEERFTRRPKNQKYPSVSCRSKANQIKLQKPHRSRADTDHFAQVASQQEAAGVLFFRRFGLLPVPAQRMALSAQARRLRADQMAQRRGLRQRTKL